MAEKLRLFARRAWLVVQFLPWVPLCAISGAIGLVVEFWKEEAAWQWRDAGRKSEKAPDA